MTKRYDRRKNEGYEIQFYDDEGNYRLVVGCETIEDVAKVLIGVCNGQAHGYMPTIYLDGKRIHS